MNKMYKPFSYKEAPKYIQLETTIVCNANCDFCTQKKVTRQPVLMEDHVWKKIIDDTRGLGITYRPFLLNEPFVDKRMLSICEYIKQDETAKLEFNTNASLLTPEISDELLKIGVDCIKFSIDGYYSHTYKDRRKGLDFDTVVNNTEYFCKKAKGKTFTNVRMIAFPNTEEEQALFLNKWCLIADKADITILYRYPWEGQKDVVYKPCLKIRDEMFFYVDGRATLCCWDTSERAVIGDIKKQNVVDIWNGESLKTYRSYLDAGQRDKITLCSRCDAYKDFDFNTDSSLRML